jgi:hypothetical protein
MRLVFRDAGSPVARYGIQKPQDDKNEYDEYEGVPHACLPPLEER